MMRVLIVDDQPTHLMMLSTFLEEVGYTVATAHNGHQAFEYLRRTAELPGIILLDVAMPTMTGWEFLRAQHQDARLATIPVVVMTALGPLAHQNVPPSAIALLEKPINLGELEELLGSILHPQLQTQALAE